VPACVAHWASGRSQPEPLADVRLRPESVTWSQNAHRRYEKGMTRYDLGGYEQGVCKKRYEQLYETALNGVCRITGTAGFLGNTDFLAYMDPASKVSK